MTEIAGSPCALQGSRPGLTVGEIFRTYGPAYAQQHDLSPEQAKVMRAIIQCRTAEMGGHVYVCTSCGHQTPMYNSCRNRHCPTCQNLDQARWISERQERVLPVAHFHVVFTLPEELRALVMANPKQLYDLLLRSSGETLVELGRDPKWLGAHLGVTTVLHTWTRDLRFHPHAHCVVTAGGLAVEGSPRWVHTASDFLFPVHVMSALFRGKFLAGLRQLHDDGKLRAETTPEGEPQFARLVDQLYKKQWVAYAKEPFSGADHVFKYLGRYTHRVGISNQRLQSIDENGVCFYTKNGNNCTLSPDEFIRRFLLHVLPKGFRKIRHYGLLGASNVNTKLTLARRLLQPGDAPAPCNKTPQSWEELMEELTGVDVLTCPACGSSAVECRSLQPVRGGGVPLGRDTS